MMPCCCQVANDAAQEKDLPWIAQNLNQIQFVQTESTQSWMRCGWISIRSGIAFSKKSPESCDSHYGSLQDSLVVEKVPELQ